jgi:hypothetical protein
VPALCRGTRHLAEAEPVVQFAVGERPASDVTTEPRNWSVSRRSKSSLTAAPFYSPAGFVMKAAFKSA